MRRGWGAIVVLCWAVGCEEEVYKHELTDSLGVAFAIETQGPAYDFSYPEEEPLACNASRPGWGAAWNRVIELCTACYSEDGTWSSAPLGDCRPVVCDEHADCPRLRDYWFGCYEGLCQNIEMVDEPTISEHTARLLCAADVPRFRLLPADPQPDLDTRLEALSCDDQQRTCALPLPDGCLQP